MSIQINGKVLNAGEIRKEMFPLGNRIDGSVLGVPMMGIVGKKDGPTLGIVTGVHGDEYEGPEAVRTLFSLIDPEKLCGSIICTPQANCFAAEDMNRCGWIDHQDLNRSFPGSPEGNITQRVANVLVKEIIEQSDYLIDLHAGGMVLDLVPYVGFNAENNETGKKSREMAKVFGIETLYGCTPFANVLRLEAAKRNIPTILVEVGGEGRFRENCMNTMVEGILNVLRFLNMLEEPVKPLCTKHRFVRAYPEGEFANSPAGGMLRIYKPLGSDVKKGDLLCTIHDVFGNVHAKYFAPYDGYLFTWRSLPSIRVGDWMVSVVEVLDEQA